MKYSSQLKGWAVDRVLELVKINQQQIELTKMIEMAQELADFCYVPQEAANDLQQQIEDIKHELATLQAISMKPASNALDGQGNA